MKLEATRVLYLLEEVMSEVEGLLSSQLYEPVVVLEALHYMHKAVEEVRKLSNGERGIIL